MSENRLIEIIDSGHKDLYPFLFATQILIKEKPGIKEQFTHLYINRNSDHCYSFNGASVRRARIFNEYEPGLYRVFKRSAKNTILYLSDVSVLNYPAADEPFKTGDAQPMDQIQISEYHYHGHAQIIQAIDGEEAINADLLKCAQGVYDLYMIERNIILKNEDFAIAIAPIQMQRELPLGDQEAKQTLTNSIIDTLEDGDSVEISGPGIPRTKFAKRDGKIVDESDQRKGGD